MMFARGYSILGITDQTYHVHVRFHGDWDEIIFRDYLNSNPEIRLNYEKLKLALAKKFRNNRELYTSGKSRFISTVMKQARKNTITE